MQIIIENSNKIIECKSWELTDLAFQNFVGTTTTLTGSVKQFNTYLSDFRKVKSIQNKEYWFDKLKLNGSTDTTPIKGIFKQMIMQNNVLTFNGNQIFNTIWANVGLRSGLFPNLSNADAKNEFTNIINDTNNSFYNFIYIK